MLLEFDHNVVSYHEQPFTLYYELLGKKTRYTPDTHVVYKNGTEKIFEVKYEKEILSDPILQEKLKILESVVYTQRSLPFHIFTDNDISDIYLKNAKFLYHFAFIPENIPYSSTIRQIVHEEESGITIQHILEKISSKRSVHLLYLPYIWHEVFKHIHSIDMYRKLTMHTVLYQGDFHGKS